MHVSSPRRSDLLASAALAVVLSFSAVPAVFAQDAAAPAGNAAPAPVSAPAQTPAETAKALPAIGPEGAADIARQIDEVVGLWLAPKSQKAKYEWKGGAPTVTPAGDHYDIATNPLAIRLADGTAVEIGPVKLRAVPQPDGALALDGALLTKATILDHDKTEAELTVGQQSFAGVWSPAYGNFLTLNFVCGDVRLISPKDEGQITLDKIALVQDLKRDHDDVFSGTGSWTIEKFSLRDEDKEELAFVGKLDAAATITHVDLLKIRDLVRMANETPEDQLKPQDVVAKLRGVLGGVSARFSADAMHFNTHEEHSKHEEETGATELGHIAWNVGIENLDQNEASASLGFEASDLRSDELTEFAKVMPTLASFSVSIGHVPTDLLSRVFDAAENKGLPINEAAALAALQKAKTEVKLNAAKIDAPMAAASAEGGASFVEGAVMGVAGKLAVTLRGLDAVVAELKPKNGQKPDKSTSDLLGGLAMLQAMGQLSKDGQGRDLRTFNLEYTPDGILLLNGADMSAMLGGEQPNKPAGKKDTPKGEKKK